MKNVYVAGLTLVGFAIIGMLFVVSIVPAGATERWSIDNRPVWITSPPKAVIKKQKRIYTKKRRRNLSRTSRTQVRRSQSTFKGHRMPSAVRAKLRQIEKKFGRIYILSSCRKGATVKKTGRPSMHRYCRAVDFKPSRNYWKVARYLKATWKGGVGTYSTERGGKNITKHIHIDNHRGRWHN